METTAAMDVAQVMGDSFTGMSSDVMGIIAIVLPIALGLFGLFFAIKKGMRFFKSSTNSGG